jgi:hypothetical protein
MLGFAYFPPLKLMFPEFDGIMMRDPASYSGDVNDIYNGLIHETGSSGTLPSFLGVLRESNSPVVCFFS